MITVAGIVARRDVAQGFAVLLRAQCWRSRDPSPAGFSGGLRLLSRQVSPISASRALPTLCALVPIHPEFDCN